MLLIVRFINKYYATSHNSLIFCNNASFVYLIARPELLVQNSIFTVTVSAILCQHLNRNWIMTSGMQTGATVTQVLIISWHCVLIEILYGSSASAEMISLNKWCSFTWQQPYWFRCFNLWHFFHFLIIH